MTTGTTVAFNHDAAHAFLVEAFNGQPGFVQVCSTGKWTGEFFVGNDAGLTAAAVHAQMLDMSRPAGIYFRATTLREIPAAGARGGAEHTAAVPMLWADVDFGTEGHKGAHLPPTEEAAEQLIAESGLPAPTILVHSGGGLYPLWRLREPLAPGLATDLSKHVQQALLRASEPHNWGYGTGVSDLARVLRLPGSVNRKTTVERPCRVIGGTGRPVTPGGLAVPLPPPPIRVGAPPAVPLPPRRPVDPGRALGPLDALAEHTTWRDILEPTGWTLVAIESDGAERWLRPGNPSSEYSARAFEHNLVVHSEDAGLPSGAGQRLTRGRVFAWLHHHGDTSAAAADIVRAACGTGGTAAAHALPAAALAAVRAVHDTYDPWDRLVEGGTAALVRQALAPFPAPVCPARAPLDPQASDQPVQAPASTVASPVIDQQPAGLARFLLPAEVWEFSDPMRHIYQAAMARLVCPDALLHAVLTIIASLLHHHSRVETGKGPSVLSYYLAVVGASGAGKSEALKVARELLASWSGARFAITGAEGYVDAPLGSGEGLIEAFMGEDYVDVLGPDGEPALDKLGMPKQARVRKQVRHNALFHTDEGRQVLAIDARKGATVLAVLCELWSGSVAGQTNAESSRTRKLDAGSYVVGLLLGFQVATIDALFADEAGGAPQRFAFAPAEYAPFGDDLDGDEITPWPGELQLSIPPGVVMVSLTEDQQRAVRRAIRMKAAGISDDGPLDGHRMLLHCRLAGLLALLHAREVDDELWQLAGSIVARSCALRDHLGALGQRKAAELAQAKQDKAVETAVRAQTQAQNVERVVRAAGQIARAVERNGGSTTRGKALNGIRSELRDVKDEALAYAERRGLVVVSEDGGSVALPEAS
jgi:hypothetical protein